MSSQGANIDPATVSVAWSGGGAYGTAVVVHGGSGYKVGNRFRISGTALGGTTPANDLIVTAATVSGIVGGPGSIVTVSVSGTGTGTGSSTVVLEYAGAASGVVRDASDVTRQTRERMTYLMRNIAGSHNSLPSYARQDNSMRLSYLFGRLKCGACVAGAFNQNGGNPPYA